jgi:gamma-glutamylcyclotransferase (GGCT)/AIG2-like uncharacterized protein YtfP
MHALFAYGTLVIEEIMRQVTGWTFQSRHALLQGFARYRIKEVHYPGIIPYEGAGVIRKLYFDIDNRSLARLDYFEDDFYEKILVRVTADNGQTYDALTYKVKDEYAGVLSHEAWVPDEFKREHIK